MEGELVEKLVGVLGWNYSLILLPFLPKTRVLANIVNHVLCLYNSCSMKISSSIFTETIKKEEEERRRKLPLNPNHILNSINSSLTKTGLLNSKALDVILGEHK